MVITKKVLIEQIDNCIKEMEAFDDKQPGGMAKLAGIGIGSMIGIKRFAELL